MANYKFHYLSTALNKAGDQIERELHISTTNSKLKSIPSFNLLPGITCSKESCGHCLREGCYAVKNAFRCGYNYDKNSTLRAWSENTWQAMHELPELYVSLYDWLAKHRNTIKLFRVHSSGDFFSVDYALMWFALGKAFPEIRFLAFTKQWDVIRQVAFYNLPNFSVVLSGWTGIAIPDDLRKYYRCAWCDDGIENRIPDDAMECPGDCEQCGLCWYLNEIGRDTKFTKH